MSRGVIHKFSTADREPMPVLSEREDIIVITDEAREAHAHQSGGGGARLSKTQEVAVKKVARELLEKLEDQLAVDAWQTKQQTRAAVQSTIRFTLNELPEEPYPEPVWNEKVDVVWAFIFARRQAQSDATTRT